MVQTIDRGTRTARKAYRCGLCSAPINPGDRHAASVNIYDDRIYTWRDCLACERDQIVTYVSDWDGGWSDEGVDFEKAIQWAAEAVAWPSRWLPWGPNARRITTTERMAARNFLARAAGDE